MDLPLQENAMSNYPSNYPSIVNSAEFQQELAAQRTFMARVYGWMTIGLLVTALTALAISMTDIQRMLAASRGVFLAIILVQFGVACGMGALLNRIPAAVAGLLFLVYSFLTGVTFSLLFLIYTSSSIYSVFFITAGMFGTMSFVGYVTRKDLSSFGNLLFMALIGLVIASIVNMFLWSPALYWLISYVGVALFVGLTAYDTQKIKQAYAEGGTGSDVNNRIAIFGAFMLYLDFINIFIYLLRILGSRRN
jgi:FtsH-binding integral membrane protein